MGSTEYIVAQLGARMHYAVPQILQEADSLKHLYTDICAVKGWPRLLGLVPEPLKTRSMKRLLGRKPRNVPARKITAFTALGFEYAKRRRQAQGRDETIDAYLWANREFCRKVMRGGFREANAVFAYNSAALEILAHARDLGLMTVVEQTIAPWRVANDILLAEHTTYPEWEVPIAVSDAEKALIEREEQEWKLADLILCGSDFVRDGIEAAGGPVDRCVTVPYGVDMASRQNHKVNHHSGPLRVLTVGTVNLRKGAPYVLAAARELKNTATFRMAGLIEVLPPAEKQLREHVELLGSVPRSEIQKHFEWADVFLLPSLCEGSATAIYEALSFGLPVITTPNSGSIVRDEKEGYIVPIRDTHAITDKLTQLVSQPDLLETLSQNAKSRSEAGNVKAYAQRLLSVLCH